MNSKPYVCLLSVLITAGAIPIAPLPVVAKDSSFDDFRQIARVTFYEGRFSEAESYLRKTLAHLEATRYALSENGETSARRTPFQGRREAGRTMYSRVC